jgi:sigma-B regulation protein RsbU (phosphoserine phosphatase)
VAGHPLPLHVSPGGVVTPIGEAGSLIGVLDDVALSESSAPLAPGDALVVYTDGVSEGRSRSGEFFGDARVFGHLTQASGSAGDMAGSLLADVLEFQEGIARDDIAIVALRVPPAAA